MTDDDEMGTRIEKQIDRVRSVLLNNPDAIILIVPDEFHRHVAQKAFEKQIKNANAATGTVSALVEAEDELITRTIGALTSLHAIATNARPAAHQLDGTPMGRAIEQEGRQQQRARRGGEPQQVGQILDGVKWADEVPEPRPEVGQLIRLPNGLTTSIEYVFGYMGKQGDLDAFDVKDTADWRGLVYPHAGEWRLVAQRAEYTDAAEPQEGTETASASDQASGANPEGTNEEFPGALDEDDDEPAYEITSVEKAGDASDPFSLAASREQEQLEAEGGSPVPDDVDRHTSMAGDLDEEEQERQNFSGSDDLVDAQQDVASAEREKAKGKKTKVSRSKLQKGKKSTSSKKR